MNSTPIPGGELRLRPLASAFAVALACAPTLASALHEPMFSATALRSPQVQIVSNCNDSGSGSLRSAVANAVNGDTIDLTQLNCGTITLDSGEITVGGFASITVNGPGADRLVIDANHNGRVFNTSGSLDISGVTLANGLVTADVAEGGCVLSSLQITLRNARVTGCAAQGVSAADGGGTSSQYPTTLISTTVSGNTASASAGPARGGGVYTSYGAVTSRFSTVSGNKAVGAPGMQSIGGGIYAVEGADIMSSTVDNNKADVAAGIMLRSFFSHDARITDSTISNNIAAVNAGGILFERNVSLHLVNTTVAFNQAVQTGKGGLVIGWPAPQVAISSSIIANNTLSPNALAEDLNDAVGATITGANDLVVASFATLPSGWIRTDPMLGPLQFNGGPTRTHELLAGSPAIDAGNNAANLDYDQRGQGYPRVSGPAADIGAFEVQPDLIFADGFD